VEADRRVEVPEVVRQRVALLGEEGARWLTGLADLVAGLERRWSISVGAPLAGGGAAFVARATSADGHDAVLKVAIPGEDVARQARTLAGARGRGYVLLLASDLEERALLLEALGPPMRDLDLPPERMLVALCRTLRHAWTVPRPPGLTVEPAEEKARTLGELVRTLWEDLGRPCSDAAADLALRCADRRAAAFDLDACVVVHGDPHPGNALRVRQPRSGAESGFVFVDPDGFLADPAYDLGVVLRDWCPQLLAGDPVALARRYCRLLAHETGVDETATWEWGFLERVSSGLFLLQLGAEDLAQPFLTTAERLATGHPG
jgi:streptomycin 6-kinase